MLNEGGSVTSNEAWKEASPSKQEEGENPNGGGGGKYFVAGSYNSPKAEPPKVLRDAQSRAEMSSREGVRSRGNPLGDETGPGMV